MRPGRFLLGVAVALALATAAAILIHWRRPRLSPAPEQTSVSVTQALPEALLETFELKERREDRFSTRSSYFDSRRNWELELEVIPDLDAESAQTLIDEGIMGIIALYANALSAYPEKLSRKLDTPTRFQPELSRREIDGVTVHYFHLFATDRLTYGATHEDTAKRRSVLAWVYAPGHSRLYKVKVFAPLETSWESMDGFLFALPYEA